MVKAPPPQNGKLASPEEWSDGASIADTPALVPQGSDTRNVVRKKLTGYVGFANLPNQWHRKSVRKGFNFNVMVVGKWTMRLSWYDLGRMLTRCF